MDGVNWDAFQVAKVKVELLFKLWLYWHTISKASDERFHFKNLAACGLSPWAHFSRKIISLSYKQTQHSENRHCNPFESIIEIEKNNYSMYACIYWRLCEIHASPCLNWCINLNARENQHSTLIIIASSSSYFVLQRIHNRVLLWRHLRAFVMFILLPISPRSVIRLNWFIYPKKIISYKLDSK